VDGRALRGPNDLVMDGQGGFYFTDLGKAREGDLDYGGLYYGRIDGSLVKTIAYGLFTSNGCGLSPDGKIVYVAETRTGRVWAWDIEAPGVVSKKPWPSPNGGKMIFASPNYVCFDSLAIESNGNVAVATFMQGGITVVSPSGQLVEFVPCPTDWFITNICFGGADMCDAFWTSSGKGELLKSRWKRPGLKLHYQDL
jgi:gluconolactonase